MSETWKKGIFHQIDGTVVRLLIMMLRYDDHQMNNMLTTAKTLKHKLDHMQYIYAVPVYLCIYS